MKTGKKTDSTASFTQPLLQDLKERQQLEFERRNPLIGSEPLASASLYQDSGSGYNSNFTFPQD